MYRFFTPPESVGEEHITIRGETARHIARALRMAKGETITVCDGRGTEYVCSISDFDEDRAVYAHIISSRIGEGEPGCSIRLYQAYPKGDKLESIVMKATELGATEIVPFISRRCVSRPDRSRQAKIRDRLSKIALGAAEQSHRSLIPAVGEALSFGSMINEATSSRLCLFCYEGGEGLETEHISDILASLPTVPESISIIVGSEGGFEPDEAKEAKEAGALLCSLGTRILRCETAPLYALSAICSHFKL